MAITMTEIDEKQAKIAAAENLIAKGVWLEEALRVLADEYQVSILENGMGGWLFVAWDDIDGKAQLRRSDKHITTFAEAFRMVLDEIVGRGT